MEFSWGNITFISKGVLRNPICGTLLSTTTTCVPTGWDFKIVFFCLYCGEQTSAYYSFNKSLSTPYIFYVL